MLRTPQMSDYPAWAELRAAEPRFPHALGAAVGEPMSYPAPRFAAACATIFAICARMWAMRCSSFAATSGDLVGGLTLCNVRRGVTQSCTLGYWIGARYARRAI